MQRHQQAALGPRPSVVAPSLSFGPNLQPGAAQTLFELAPYALRGTGRACDLSPDDEFLMIKRPVREADSELGFTLFLNWFEERKARVPVP